MRFAKNHFFIYFSIIGIAATLTACITAAESNVTDESVPTNEPTITSDQNPLPTSAPVTPNPFARPTSEATEESTREHPNASANVLYQIADNTMMSYITATGESWVFTGMNFPLRLGQSGIGAMDTNIYALARPEELALQLFEVTPVMTRPLTINAHGEPRGIAAVLEPGTPNIWLAVGLMDYSVDSIRSQLILQIVDAADAKVIATQEGNATYWVPVRWSSDAARLYFSEEPGGIGGYILFDGWSSLNVYDTGENTSTPLLLTTDSRSRMICLDDLSPDEQFVAHHCETAVGIGIQNVLSGEQTVMIAPPTTIIDEIKQMGSARFSPDGSRIAFALARGNPDEEQGWVAATDDLTGTSRLLMTSEPHSYYNVKAWVDEHTIIVQEYRLDGHKMLWLVPVDGGEPQLIGEGVYVAIIPALVP